jgi:hypothetical protein
VTRPTAAELLATPDALLTRSHLRDLGLERRAVDAVFRTCPVGAFPGYSRPMIRVRDYLTLLEESTFDGRSRISLTFRGRAASRTPSQTYESRRPFGL